MDECYLYRLPNEVFEIVQPYSVYAYNSPVATPPCILPTFNPRTPSFDRYITPHIHAYTTNFANAACHGG